MIAQREQEIREFVPKPYYTVTAAAGGVVYTWKDENRAAQESPIRKRQSRSQRRQNGIRLSYRT